MRLRTLVLVGVLASGVSAQHPTGSLLVIETANHVAYVRDVADYSLLATKPDRTTVVLPRNFDESVIIADIVSVNGRRVRGTVLETLTIATLRPAPAPGQAIADITRSGMVEWYFEILHEDGQLIGSIRVSGMIGGQAPPGQTRQIQQGSYVVVGGNGAFLGAHGYMGAAGPASARTRDASMTEDPANRRLHGGGSIRQGIYILPMFQPEVVAVSGSAAIVHSSDFTLVTAAKPARSGEILTLFASGLGPTRPGVEPGQPFPADPLQACNSPIEVLVNGKPGEVLYAGGYPGAVDRYQVNFRVPDGITPGMASVQLTSAWIAGPEVRIPMQ